VTRTAILAALALAGCSVGRAGLDEYRGRLAGEGAMEIVQLNLAKPDPDSVLRKKAKDVDPLDPLLPELLGRMSASLEKTGGVGIAAPQIGVSRRVILVRHGTRPKGQPTRVEAYLNPALEWSSPEVEDDYEACLSVGDGGGLVPRARAVRVRYQKPGSEQVLHLELADWDARIMQHEVDHVDGKLFIDKLKGELMPIEEMRRRRDEGHRARGWIPPES
jgi:peptide deformylase